MLLLGIMSVCMHNVVYANTTNTNTTNTNNTTVTESDKK